MNLCHFPSFSISVCRFYANMLPWSNSAYFRRIFRLVMLHIFLKNSRIKPSCLCDADDAAVDGESVDDVPDCPFIVRCRWRTSGRNEHDLQACIVAVECRRQQSDTSADSVSTESSRSLVDTVTVAIQCLNKRLSTRSISKCQGIRALKAFVRVDCFSTEDLCQG